MRILALGRLRPTIVSLHCHLRWRQGCLPALLRSTAYSLLSLLSESQWPWLAYPWKQSCVVDLTLWAQSAMACCACGPLITLAHFLRISTLGASEAFVFLKQGPTIQPIKLTHPPASTSSVLGLWACFTDFFVGEGARMVKRR